MGEKEEKELPKIRTSGQEAEIMLARLGLNLCLLRFLYLNPRTAMNDCSLNSTRTHFYTFRGVFLTDFSPHLFRFPFGLATFL